MIKICQLKSNPTEGGSLVQLFTPGDLNGAAEFFSMGISKSAAPLLPEVQHYLERVRPDPNKIVVLVNALGASEYWGSNINGDAFPEEALVHDGPDYGHKTFLNAFPYMHHQNKDPSRSFGRVAVAVWNDHMKRVELVVELFRDLARRFGAEGVIDKLDAGMFPDVSMGTKVPYDLCSICTDWDEYRRAQSTFNPKIHKTVGQAVLDYHKRKPIRGLSVTRNDYCQHAKFYLNKILPDGRRVCVINDYPRFFDISFVFIGADKTAKVLAKLASAGIHADVVPSAYLAEQFGYVDDEDIGMVRSQKVKTASYDNRRKAVEAVRNLMRKKAELKKAEIIKDVIPSQFGGKAIPLGPQYHPDLPTEILDQLGHCPLEEALSTPSSLGIVLKPREFQRIILVRMGKQSLADSLDQSHSVFAPTDEVSDDILMGGDFINRWITKLLLPFLEERSILEPVARRRMIKIIMISPRIRAPIQEEIDDPFLSKLSSAYNGYLLNLGRCLVSGYDHITNNADVWSAINRENALSMMDKTAEPRLNAKELFGSVGAALLASQLARKKQERAMTGMGPQTGIINDFVADNPHLLATAAGLASLRAQGFGFPKHVVEQVETVGDRLLKSVLR